MFAQVDAVIENKRPIRSQPSQQQHEKKSTDVRSIERKKNKVHDQPLRLKYVQCHSKLHGGQRRQPTKQYIRNTFRLFFLLLLLAVVLIAVDPSKTAAPSG